MTYYSLCLAIIVQPEYSQHHAPAKRHGYLLYSLTHFSIQGSNHRRWISNVICGLSLSSIYDRSTMSHKIVLFLFYYSMVVHWPFCKISVWLYFTWGVTVLLTHHLIVTTIFHFLCMWWDKSCISFFRVIWIGSALWITNKDHLS